MPQTFISVVIPTRERCEVLGKALQTVTEQDYDALEIIVSDNCSSDETRDVVAAVSDPRVRYLNTGKRISMSHNWEFALSHVRPGWLSIIGDDDGLLPGSLRRLADIIRETNVQALRSATCYYSWPSLTATSYGRLRVPLKSGYEVRDCREWLIRVVHGKADYPQLPMLYNGGFVDFSVMERLRARTGSFYRSCIPDVYAAVSIASIIDRYVYVHEPLAINGASKYSTGTSQMSAHRASTTSPAHRFANEGNIPFHPDVPLAADGTYPVALQAMVYESALQTMDLRDFDLHTSPAHQLGIVMQNNVANFDAVRDWALGFARHHGLDFEAIQWAVRGRSRRTQLRLARERLVAALNLYNTDWPDFPIRNVHEAGIVAACILSIRPSRLRNIGRIAKLAGQGLRRFRAADATA